MALKTASKGTEIHFIVIVFRLDNMMLISSAGGANVPEFSDTCAIQTVHCRQLRGIQYLFRVVSFLLPNIN